MNTLEKAKELIDEFIKDFQKDIGYKPILLIFLIFLQVKGLLVWKEDNDDPIRS